MDLPITLVIKAPNQRVDDQTVDCMLGWTVKKLKQHLTDVYPSKPNEDNQRLIYSGKLLSDHLTLKEVLREFDDGSNKHTVHLVCSFSPLAESRYREPVFKKQSESQSPQSSSSSTNSQPSTSADPLSQTEGVRYRGHINPSSSTSPQPSPTFPNVFNNFSGHTPSMQQQFPAGLPAEMAAMMYGGAAPNAGGMVYSPEQYMWMQQMYAQYMAQYMQYYQQGVYNVPPNTPVTPNVGQNQPQQPLANNNQPDVAAAAADNDNLDEEFHQRDWLDYVYTFSRFLVLLGIVYFYSSLTRFLMVGAFFVVVYAYQMGWFMLRNHRGQPPQQQQQPNQQQQPQQQQEPQQNAQPDNIQPENADNADEANPATEVPASPPVPQEPGLLQISWTFISTFFTSLFPAPPPAVNVN